MENSKTKFGAVILFLIVLGVLFITLRSPNSNTAIAPAIEEKAIPPAEKSYSMSDITLHADAQSCWTSINGNVYDLTSWVNQHPGGKDAILYLCGKDGTSAFTGKHGGQPKQEIKLDSFLIGKLQ